jgi:hypothetical protein
MSLEFILKKIQEHNVVSEAKSHSQFSGLELLTESNLETLEKIIQSKLKEIITGAYGESQNEKSCVLPFGKHKGKSLREVYDEAPTYIHFLRTKCDWISKFNDLNTELQSFKL